MTWDVYWRVFARNRLVAIWDAAPNPVRMADATDDLERALAHDPDYLGESRDGRLRTVFHGPFEALIDVNKAVGEVDVLDIQLIKRGR